MKIQEMPSWFWKHSENTLDKWMQKKRYLELKNFILNRFIRIKGVVSVNLVGSFWENPKSSNYRDIDIVFILDKLIIKKFQKCKNLIASINTKKLGLS